MDDAEPPDLSKGGLVLYNGEQAMILSYSPALYFNGKILNEDYLWLKFSDSPDSIYVPRCKFSNLEKLTKEQISVAA